MPVIEICDRDGKTEKIKIEESVESAERADSLYEILWKRGIFLDAPCAGNGMCGKCRVQFLDGAGEPTDKEKKLLSEKDLKAGVRLACAVKIKNDCRICLPEKGNADIKAVTEFCPWKCEKQKGQMSSFLEQQYGIVIDIGTTTLAAELLALQTGKTLTVKTAVNHQRAYGADVLSRIQAANEGADIKLRELIWQDLRNLVEKLLADVPDGVSAVKKIVIAGNTTMCHLLLGFSCETLGSAPFLPFDLSLQKVSCREIFGENFEVWKRENGKRDGCEPEVVILPGIAAFLGADITAGIYATGMAEEHEPVMLLDMGTNGEMVIGNCEGFVAASAAAGPVFEGGKISCGVAGIPGAVTHVTLQAVEKMPEPNAEDLQKESNYKYSYKTIADESPVGFCGTGIIDMMSELVRNQIVDENGTLAEPWFTDAFPLGELVFTQEDIREVQLGKSAIRAGIETLLSEYGREPEKVYLAGGFGFDMDVEKAVRIGLFPEHMKDRIVPIGNAALAGAKRFLLEDEKTAEEKVRWIAAHTKELNLAMHPQFNEWYLQYMFFEIEKSRE